MNWTRRKAASGSSAWSAVVVTSLVGGAGLLSVTTPAAASPAAGSPWKIETVAGGVGGPGPARSIASGGPCSVTFAAGQLYLGEEGGLPGAVVRKISMRTGWMSTPAGTVDVTGPGPDGSSARGAGLSWVCGLAVDGAGNLLLSDGGYFDDGSPSGGDNQVRVDAARSGTFYGQQMRAGHIYAIAGDGRSGFSGDGGSANRAELSGPAGLAVGPAGNVIFADAGNGRVRVLAVRSGTFYGQPMTAGDIYTVAGNGTFGFSGNGGPATSAALSILPQGDGKVDLSEPWPVVRVDHAGNIVLADSFDCHVRVVAARAGRFYGQEMTAGDIYTIAGRVPAARSGACGFSGDRGPATRARLGVLSGVAVDGAGNVVVSDAGNNRVRVVAVRSGRFYGTAMTAGEIYTVAGSGALGSAGDGGPATRAEFAGPIGVAIDSAGNLLVADGVGTGDAAAYYANARVQAVAARPGRFYGVAMKAGDIYTIAGKASAFTGNRGLATRAEIEAFPDSTSFGTTGMTLDRAGNQIITDIDGGAILAVAARSGRFYGVAMRARHIYSIAGGGSGFPGGGRRAGRVRLVSPAAVTTDAAGNLLIGVYGGQRVCVLAARSGRFYGRVMRAGRVYLLAGTGKFGSAGNGGRAAAATVEPTALAVDHHGNVIVGDYGGFVRVIAARSGRFYGLAMHAGDIYRIAGDGSLRSTGNGGPARSAGVYPSGLTVDAAGNVVIADGDGARVRVVAVRTGTFYGRAMKAGHIYAIAGDGNSRPSGDGGPATAAGLDPMAVAVDATGNVVVADGSGRARVVAVKSGTYYGQPMHAGDIYTIAGGGTRGLGDGGPAVRAELVFPTAVAVAKSGAVYIADTYRLRRISR